MNEKTKNRISFVIKKFWFKFQYVINWRWIEYMNDKKIILQINYWYWKYMVDVFDKCYARKTSSIKSKNKNDLLNLINELKNAN
jgi:hypothetical protein